MSFTIDQNMFYTIIVALFTYDLIRYVIGMFTGSARCVVQTKGEGKSSPYTGTGRGPGGMVVKGKDSIRGDETAPQKEGE